MKEEMCRLFELTNPEAARQRWIEWFEAAKESGIEPLIRFANLKEKRLEGLISHSRHQISTGKLEGLNNEIKVAKRIGYPCMALLVNENNAVLHHFGDDGSCYVSCNGSDQEGFVSFCDGQYEICSYQVISKEVAMTALMDYYLNSVRSNIIQWDQLY